MAIIASIDIVTLCASLVALVFIFQGWNKSRPTEVKWIVASLISLTLFGSVSNILEWSGTTNALDMAEDFVETLAPVLWMFVFYAFVQKTANDDLKRTEKELRKSRDDLEQRVEKRTAELTEVNKRMAIEIDERKKAEEALIKSKKLLNSTGRMARVGGWDLDAKTLELTWTDETYRIHEVPSSQKPPLEKAINFFHPDDREKLSKAIQQALDKGQPYDMEIRFITAKGKQLWTRTICEPEVVNGETVRLVGTFQDVTERKLAQNTLQESLKALKEAQHVAKIGSWWYDPVSRKPDWTEEMFHIFGLEPKKEAPSYEEHRKIIHPDDWDRFDASIAAAVNEGTGCNLEFRITRPDGEVRYVNARCVAKKNEDGVVTQLVGTTQDITERILAVKKIRQMDDRLKLATRAAGLGIWDWDIPKNELVWDDGMYELYGIEKTEFTNVYDAWLNSIHPDDRAENNRISEQARRGEREYDTVFRITKPDGSVRFIKALGQVIWDSGRNPIRMMGINYDITKTKELEAKIQQTQKMEAIGTLAGGVAHDFNNILTPIIIQTELALLNLSDESPMKNSLKEVLEASNRAKELVKQILTFSRQKETQRVSLTLTPIIKEALKLLRSTLPTTIEIEEEIQAEAASVLADPTQIHQVFMNICTNAAHAMREKGGVLKVCLQEIDVPSSDGDGYPDLAPGKYIKFSVSDTGHGIDPSVKEKIFEPFFTTKGIGEGTGMGLSMVHGIVESYGGAIKVTSDVGRGSTFTVLFPTEKRKKRIPAVTDIALLEGKEHVLLVDDEMPMVKALEGMLKKLGYSVVARTSSLEALEAFRSNPKRYDLVISDQTMPNMTGVELARALLKERKDLPIILCTGFSEMIDSDGAKSIGIKEFVMKPIVMNEMAGAIRRALDN